MRVVLIGTARERRALRAAIESPPPDIVGEFRSLGEARRAAIFADGALLSLGEPEPDETVVDAERLTAREREVLELLAEGLPNKQIAERLAISDQTVKFHIASLSGKLGAANRTDAVRRAVRRGLLAL